MKKYFIVIMVFVSIGCNFDPPAEIVMDVKQYSTQDTNSSGIENQLYYEAEVKNIGGQRAIDIRAEVVAVYHNDSEVIDMYLGNLYGGNTVTLKGYHEIGAKDLRDVIIRRD